MASTQLTWTPAWADGIDPRRLLAAHVAATAFYRAHLAHAAGPRQYLADRGRWGWPR